MFKKYLQIFKKKTVKIEKRLRLAISVLFLTFLMLFSTFFYFDKASIFILVFIFISFFLSYFALLEDIKKMDWFGLFFMPITLTVFFYLFYFLFPGRWLTRLPFIFIYAVSIYAVLLCSNIFNVGVEKSLQLYRAAFSINYFYLTFVSFLFFNVLFSFKFVFLINIFGVGVGVFLLSLHLYWTIKLNKYLESQILNSAFFTAIVLAEITAVINFLPLKSSIASLFLTTTFYSLSGVIYSYIDEKLFKETIREYVGIWIFVLIITLFSISW